MTIYTPQAKSAQSYTKSGLSRSVGGEVFFGWMFLFTKPTGGSPFAKVAKASTSFIKEPKS
jgi:hypothetical protein